MLPNEFQLAMRPLIHDHGTKYFADFRMDMIWEIVKGIEHHQLVRIIGKFVEENKKPSVRDFKIAVKSFQPAHREPCPKCTSWGWVSATNELETYDFLCPDYCIYSKFMKLRVDEAYPNNKMPHYGEEFALQGWELIPNKERKYER